MSGETTEKPRRSVRRRWPVLAEIALYAVALFCLAVLLTQDLSVVLRFFYSPLAIILLVVIFVEFLIIKGGDRSRLYRIEIEKMRTREQQYVARQRRALEEIQRGLGAAAAPQAPTGGAPDAPASAPPDPRECLKRVEQILRSDLKE